jgi:hypothetical protein
LFWALYFLCRIFGWMNFVFYEEKFWVSIAVGGSREGWRSSRSG